MLKVVLDTQTGSVSLEGDTLPHGVDYSFLESKTRKGFSELVAMLADLYGGKHCPLARKEPHQIGFVIWNPKIEELGVSRTESGSAAVVTILRKP